MSNPFTYYTAKPTFAEVNEPLDAGQYVLKKKLKYSFCSPNICHPNKNIKSYDKYYGLRTANSLAFYPFSNFDNSKSQLYSNLYTKLDLKLLTNENTPIISDLNGGTHPVTIDTTVQPYLKYNIDPSGVLFGDTPCGINNFLDYVVYDVSLNSLAT
jgi:hypothetical protein